MSCRLAKGGLDDGPQLPGIIFFDRLTIMTMFNTVTF